MHSVPIHRPWLKQEVAEMINGLKNMAVLHVTQVCTHPAVCDVRCVYITAVQNQQASEAECQIEFICVWGNPERWLHFLMNQRQPQGPASSDPHFGVKTRLLVFFFFGLCNGDNQWLTAVTPLNRRTPETFSINCEPDTVHWVAYLDGCSEGEPASWGHAVKLTIDKHFAKIKNTNT